MNRALFTSLALVGLLFVPVAGALAGAVGLGGCTTEHDRITGTQSIAVELVTPTSPGSPDDRLPDGLTSVVVKLTAKDENNEVDTSFNGPVKVYVQFLGGLTPSLASAPLETVTLTNGESGEVTIDQLPKVFGPTFL